MIVNRKSIYYLRLLSDLILLNISFIFSAVLAQSAEILLAQDHMFILLAILNFIWYFYSNVTDFYDDFNSRYFAYQLIIILKSVVVQIAVSILFIFIAKEDLFTRNFILFYFFLLLILVSLRSIFIKEILKSIRKKGKNVRNLLIAGAGEVGKNFREMIEDNPEFGYNFAGFIDNSLEAPDEKLLGKLNDVQDIIEKYKIEETVIALPERDYGLIADLIKTCNRNAVRTHIIPDYFRFVSKKFRVSMIGNFPIITARNEPLDEIHWRFLKRSFDIIFSLIITIFILSWLMPLLFIIIKLDSKGPLLFIQKRIGARNKQFKCYKLRTMHAGRGEDEQKFNPAKEEDIRITRVGKFLRKTNIDELPQFINVLKGDMSVVGPRPHALAYDEKYGEVFDEIKLRHNVKPGITGWAQIHGLRGDVPDEEENRDRTIKRIEYDLWYIENWTFWLDIQIIFLTVWQMLKGKGGGI